MVSKTTRQRQRARLIRFPIFYIGTHDSIDLGEDGPTHQPAPSIQLMEGFIFLYIIKRSGEEEDKERLTLNESLNLV